jgi:hypothetical protein
MGTTLLYGKGANPQLGMSANAAGLPLLRRLLDEDLTSQSPRVSGSVNGVPKRPKGTKTASGSLDGWVVYDKDQGGNKPLKNVVNGTPKGLFSPLNGPSIPQ